MHRKVILGYGLVDAVTTGLILAAVSGGSMTSIVGIVRRSNNPLEIRNNADKNGIGHFRSDRLGRLITRNQALPHIRAIRIHPSSLRGMWLPSLYRRCSHH